MRLCKGVSALAAGWLLMATGIAVAPSAAAEPAPPDAAAADRWSPPPPPHASRGFPVAGGAQRHAGPGSPVAGGPPPPYFLPLPYFLPPPALHALHEALALTPAQKPLWQAAEEAMRALAHWRPEGSEGPEGRRPLPTPLAAGGPSLRELARAADRDHDALTRALRTARDRWIDVDEALSGEQRAFVRGTMLTGHRPPPPAAASGHRHGAGPGP